MFVEFYVELYNFECTFIFSFHDFFTGYELNYGRPAFNVQFLRFGASIGNAAFSKSANNKLIFKLRRNNVLKIGRTYCVIFFR